MTDLSRRPWLDLYRAGPATIDPPAETALDMFRATARPRPRRRARLLLRSAGHGAPVRRDVGRAGGGPAAARRRARRPRGDVPAEHSAGADHGAGRMEVRRRDRAVQPDAARARAGEDPVRLGQPRHRVPGGSLRRGGAHDAAVHGGAAHDHHLAARLPARRRAAAAGARRRHAARATRTCPTCSTSCTGITACRPSRWRSPATTSRSWSTRRAPPVRPRRR